MDHEICAVVVTYNPDITVFCNVLAGLHNQVSRIVVIDNHSENASEIEGIVCERSCEFIEIPENRGVAHAQNIGISYGIEGGADYILLMDHDTVLPEGAVRHLRETCVKLENRGIRVGAVGNAYRDAHDGQINAVWRGSGYKVIRERIDLNTESLMEVDFLIASGSLISAKTLQKTGVMDEKLFIDLVDVEWGLRAIAFGYRNFISFEKIMTHSLGNGRVNVLGREVSFHAPIRNYYMIRNSIFLFRRKYIPVAWRAYFIKRIIPFFLTFGILVANKRTDRIRFMIRGAVDGVLNRGGGYSLN